MASLVVEASLAAAWCFPDEQSAYTNGVLQALSTTLEALAPRLWAYEVHNTVLMRLRRGRLTKSHAERFFGLLKGLPVRLTDPISYDAVFALAERHNLTVYDAAYLLLALREHLSLATLDGALSQAAQKSGVSLFRLTGTL